MIMAELLVNFSVYSGISITLFLILLLAGKSEEKRSGKVLSLLMINFLIVFLAYAGIYQMPDETGLFFAIVPFAVVVPYAWGPLLYFYVKSVYDPGFRFNRSFFRHFIPFVLALVLFTLPALWQLPYLRDSSYSGYLSGIGLAIPVTGILILGYYIWSSFKLLGYYRSLIKRHYSSLRMIDLRWVSLWIKGLLAFVVLDFLIGMLAFFIPAAVEHLYLSALFFSGFIWYVGYFGIRQSPVFIPGHLLKEPEEITEPEKSILKKERAPKVYANAAEAPEAADIPERYSLLKDASETALLTEKLHFVLKEEKLYKDPDLTLRQLADAIGTSDKKLSELLNLSLQTNFFELVNRYRTEAFKEMVIRGDAKKFTLLSLAFEAGFNSKASFNRIFKQQTKLTPGEFKRKNS